MSFECCEYLSLENQKIVGNMAVMVVVILVIVAKVCGRVKVVAAFTR